MKFFSRRGPEPPGAAEQAAAELRPQPPLAKRLNRNALTVAAVIMGMTVLTAIVLLNPARTTGKTGAAAANQDEPPPVPPRPAFLDEPVHQPVPSAPSSTASGGAAGTANLAEEATSLSHDRDEERPNRRVPATETPLRTGDTRAGVDESPRDRAYQAALASPVTPGGTEARSSGGGEGSGSSLATEEQQLLSLGDSIMRTAIRPSAGGTAVRAEAGTGVAGRDVSPEPPTSFADRAASAVRPAVLAQLEPAGSPYTLRAGTVIPGLLVTAINSDLPGEIVGQVSRDVFDSRTQRIPLIPKGSRLIGTYENQIAAGQGRLLVAWTRLILPDGRSMRLPGLALTDPAGQSGARDKVDNHWRRVFGNALLLSAISAGVQLSQPAQTSVLSTPSAGQVAAGAVGQELSNVALEILRRGMDVAPTITIRAGQPFNVFLSGDLVFDEPYQPAR